MLPLEGGVYQWAKIGLSPFAGFQSAWNYGFFLILMYATSGSVVANSLSYLLGPHAAWIASSKPLILACNLGFFAIVLWINVRGLHLARWITSSGGALVIALYGLIIGLLVMRIVRGQPMAQPPIALALPAMTLLTVNLFSKIAFNALSGFEQVAIFAGECHTPERNIARSVWIAGPGIALLYILGTCAMLAHVPREKIDLIAPIAQILGASVQLLRRRRGAERGVDPGAPVRLLHADGSLRGAGFAAAHGSGVGRAAAGLVQPPASALPDAGALARCWW